MAKCLPFDQDGGPIEGIDLRILAAIRVHHNTQDIYKIADLVEADGNVPVASALRRIADAITEDNQKALHMSEQILTGLLDISRGVAAQREMTHKVLQVCRRLEQRLAESDKR